MPFSMFLCQVTFAWWVTKAWACGTLALSSASVIPANIVPVEGTDDFFCGSLPLGFRTHLLIYFVFIFLISPLSLCRSLLPFYYIHLPYSHSLALWFSPVMRRLGLGPVSAFACWLQENIWWSPTFLQTFGANPTKLYIYYVCTSITLAFPPTTADTAYLYNISHRYAHFLRTHGRKARYLM